MCSQYYFQTKCLVTCRQCAPDETKIPLNDQAEGPTEGAIETGEMATNATSVTTTSTPQNLSSSTTETPAVTSPTTSSLPTTTVNKTTTAPEKCIDNHSLCKTWKTRGYCTKREYSYAMGKYCGVTCGICTSIMNGEQQCQDESQSCGSWKAYCESSKHSAHIRKMCSKTCGLCNVNNKDKEGGQTLSTNSTELLCGVPKIRLDYSLTKYRIIGGQVAEYGSLPWNVGLYHNGGFVCGGTLIGNEYVLTAAHCFNNTSDRYPRLLKGYIAAMGKHNKSLRTRNFGEVRRHFERIIVHPDYDPTTDGNDIALIKLSEKVHYNDYVRPICLPKADEVLPNYAAVLVSGWGYTGPSILTK